MAPMLITRPSSPQVTNFLYDVQTLWKEQDEVSWWPAKVLTVFTTTAYDALASGTVIYEKMLGYDEDIFEVQFLYKRKDGRILSHVGNDGKGQPSKNVWTF